MDVVFFKIESFRRDEVPIKALSATLSPIYQAVVAGGRVLDARRFFSLRRVRERLKTLKGKQVTL
jgi:hypothetical protein